MTATGPSPVAATPTATAATMADPYRSGAGDADGGGYGAGPGYGPGDGYSGDDGHGGDDG